MPELFDTLSPQEMRTLLRQQQAQIEALENDSVTRMRSHVSDRVFKRFVFLTEAIKAEYEKRLDSSAPESTIHGGGELEETVLLNGKRRKVRPVFQLGNKEWLIGMIKVMGYFCPAEGVGKKKDEALVERCRQQYSLLMGGQELPEDF